MVYVVVYRCMLYGVWCMLHVVCCMLYVVCCMLYVASKISRTIYMLSLNKSMKKKVENIESHLAVVSWLPTDKNPAYNAAKDSNPE